MQQFCQPTVPKLLLFFEDALRKRRFEMVPNAGLRGEQSIQLAEVELLVDGLEQIGDAMIAAHAIHI